MSDADDVLREADRELARADRELARVSNLPKFRSPLCGKMGQAIVLEGRPDLKAGHYWRRHKCLECGDTYTTKQVVEPLDRPSLASQHLVA